MQRVMQHLTNDGCAHLILAPGGDSMGHLVPVITMPAGSEASKQQQQQLPLMANN
jgi:hypothetical protein